MLKSTINTSHSISTLKGKTGRGDGGKKGKGLVKERVCRTRGHRRQCGDRLWEQGEGGAEESKGGALGQLQ